MRREIEAWTKLRAPIGRARDVVVTQPERLFADRCRSEDRIARRYPTSLDVAVGHAGVRRDVIVEAGYPDPQADHLVLPVSWEATGGGRLLPSFVGAVEVVDDGVRSRLGLRGSYTLPLGLLGRFGDSVAGRRVAQQSLTTFVAEIARRLDAEVDRRNEAAPFPQPHYHVDLHEVGPENYLG